MSRKGSASILLGLGSLNPPAADRTILPYEILI